MDPVADIIQVATYLPIVLAPYRLLSSHPVQWLVGVSIFFMRLGPGLLAPRSWCVSQFELLAKQASTD